MASRKRKRCNNAAVPSEMLFSFSLRLPRKAPIAPKKDDRACPITRAAPIPPLPPPHAITQSALEELDRQVRSSLQAQFEKYIERQQAQCRQLSAAADPSAPVAGKGSSGSGNGRDGASGAGDPQERVPVLNPPGAGTRAGVGAVGVDTAVRQIPLEQHRTRLHLQPSPPAHSPPPPTHAPVGEVMGVVGGGFGLHARPVHPSDRSGPEGSPGVAARPRAHAQPMGCPNEGAHYTRGVVDVTGWPTSDCSRAEDSAGSGDVDGLLTGRSSCDWPHPPLPPSFSSGTHPMPCRPLSSSSSAHSHSISAQLSPPGGSHTHTVSAPPLPCSPPTSVFVAPLAINPSVSSPLIEPPSAASLDRLEQLEILTEGPPKCLSAPLFEGHAFQEDMDDAVWETEFAQEVARCRAELSTGRLSAYTESDFHSMAPSKELARHRCDLTHMASKSHPVTFGVSKTDISRHVFSGIARAAWIPTSPFARLADFNESMAVLCGRPKEDLSHNFSCSDLIASRYAARANDMVYRMMSQGVTVFDALEVWGTPTGHAHVRSRYFVWQHEQSVVVMVESAAVDASSERTAYVPTVVSSSLVPGADTDVALPSKRRAVTCEALHAPDMSQATACPTASDVAASFTSS